MENWIRLNATLFLNLRGASLHNIITFEQRFTDEPNIEFKTKHQFLYCLSIWIAAEDQYWLISTDQNEFAEFTLTFMRKSATEFLAAAQEPSTEEIPKHILDQYYQDKVNEITFGADAEGTIIESVCLRLNSGHTLYLFCGEYNQDEKGSFKVFPGDEMVLLFERKEDFEFFGFKHESTMFTID